MTPSPRAIPGRASFNTFAGEYFLNRQLSEGKLDHDDMITELTFHKFDKKKTYIVNGKEITINQYSDAIEVLRKRRIC